MAEENRPVKNHGIEADETSEVVDWKRLGTLSPEGKRSRKRSRIRQIPEFYFLPRRSIPATLVLYGSIIAAGIGAGMLVEKWIEKKVAEDGGVLWDMDGNQSGHK